MKFKRILAAVLSSLMLVSMMSFTATVGAADGIIKEAALNQNFNLERGDTKASTNMYEAETGIGYRRLVPRSDLETVVNTSNGTTIATSSCYINLSGQNIKPTVEQCEADTIYAVFYVRTNMTMDDNDTPFLNLYTTTWGTAEKNVSASPTATLVTDNENFITQLGSEWGTMCFKIPATLEVDLDGDSSTPKTAENLYKWDQVALFAAGSAANKGIGEWWTSVPEGETPYIDFAGYAVVDNLAAAEAYDFEAAAAAPTVTLTFDANNADGDSDVTTAQVASGTWNSANVEFPEVTAPEGMEFVGWSSTTDVSGIVDTEAGVAIPTANTTYTAIWQEAGAGAVLELSGLTINKTTAATYGVSDLTADEFVIKLPYGWDALEELGVMPEVVPTATLGEAVYTAPATLSEAGKITITNSGATKEIPVKFEIAESASAKTAGTAKITSGVDSSTGDFADKDGNIITKTTARGLFTEKNVEVEGVDANKFTPVYQGSELDGTTRTSTTYYSSVRGVNLEGYDAFGIYDYESYPAYRALVYYDKGADGEFDVTPNPTIWFQSTNATGTFATGGNSQNNALKTVNNYNGGRWEYIYFVKEAKHNSLYGKVRQPVFSLFSSSAAKNYTDDVFYFAEVTMFSEVPDYVQYQPTALVATAVDGDVPGYVSGVTSDMEMLVGETWTAVTELESYADGKVSGLAAGTYSFRYAATDVLLASEATEVEVLPGAVFITFDAQNGEEAEPVEYEVGTAVTAPAENPVKASYIFKGWAETADGTKAVDFTNVTAAEDKTYYAIWELITKVYVDSTAAEAGDGLTAGAPVTDLKTAWDILSNNGGTIVIVGDTPLDSRSNPDVRLTNGMGDIVITNKDGDKTYDGKLIFAYQSSFKNSASATGKLTFENLNIVQEHSYGGSSKNVWRYVNFDGIEVEFGEGINIVSTAEADGYTTLKMRMGGEYNYNHFGRKVIIRSGAWAQLVLGGKNGPDKPYSLDVEYYGGTGTLSLGNDSNSWKSTDGTITYYRYGKINDAKLLFEATPTGVNMQNIWGVDGAMQVIANNGAEVKMPAFSYSNSKDTTTNEDGTAFTADLTPKGGYWKLNSAAGGRVDFTETAGTFTVTTDATYILVTDKATGEQTKIRVSDGVSGEANLFADGTYALTLEAGEYDIAYTDEAVKIKVTFVGDTTEEYTIAKGETATFTGTYTAPAGKVLAGWKSDDGTVILDGNSYTADTYYADGITFYPLVADDSTVPYYYAYGEYDSLNAKYIVDVKIANGEFTAGTLGVTFDKDILAYKNYTLGEGISNNLGDSPDIVKDYMYDGEDNKFILVWDAAQGAIDASEEEVTIVTFEFDVLDAEFVKSAVENGGVAGADYFAGDTTYEKYFKDGYYLASPKNTSDNPYAVDYVPVYYGAIVNTEKSYQKASVTFNITFASKEGATVANVGKLGVYSDDVAEKVYTVDAEGNSEATVTQVVSDFYVGDTFSYYVHKNGYISAETVDVVAEDGMTINITLLAGDIKDSAEKECGDGEITLADFVRVVRAFEETASTTYESYVDLNESGAVSVEDLSVIKTNFGKTAADNTIEVVKADAE